MTRLVGVGAAALAVVAGSARADDPQPDALEEEAPAGDRGAWDITGRLRAGPDGLSLEIGGALVELRISHGEPSGDEPSGSRPPGAHDLRATFSVDGKTTGLLLRIVPPPEDEAPAEGKQPADRRPARSPRMARSRRCSTCAASRPGTSGRAWRRC